MHALEAATARASVGAAQHGTGTGSARARRRDDLADRITAAPSGATLGTVAVLRQLDDARPHHGHGRQGGDDAPYPAHRRGQGRPAAGGVSLMFMLYSLAQRRGPAI